jgi:hypothetical protein
MSFIRNTKGVIRSCKLKERQYNGPKKQYTQRSTKHCTRSSNTKPTKNRGWTHVLWKVKQFLLHMSHPSCYSCYKHGDKSWIRKEPECDYDNWNIFFVDRCVYCFFGPLYCLSFNLQLLITPLVFLIKDMDLYLSIL